MSRLPTLDGVVRRFIGVDRGITIRVADAWIVDERPELVLQRLRAFLRETSWDRK